MPRQKKGADGYYRLTFSHGGKQYSVRSKNPKELSAKMTAKVKELDGGVRIINAGIMVKDWAQEWLDTYKQGISPASRTRLRGQLERYVAPHIGYMAVTDVRPVHCQRLLNDMQGMSTDLVKKVRSLLHNLFLAAVDNSLCRDNPADRLTLPATAAKGTHRAFTDRERIILLATAKTLLDSIKTRTLATWVLLLLYTGLRPGESVMLTGADIRDGYVHVTKALDRRSRGEKAPKSVAGVRKVPIIPQLQAVLPTSAPGELLFKNRVAKQWDNKAIARHWKLFLEAMADTERKLIETKAISPLAEAVTPLVPYNLRHTFCTDLERAGVPINVASQLMGHSSIEITAKIYTHTRKDVFDDAAAKLTALALQTGDVVGDVPSGCNTVQKGAI